MNRVPSAATIDLGSRAADADAIELEAQRPSASAGPRQSLADPRRGSPSLRDAIGHTDAAEGRPGNGEIGQAGQGRVRAGDLLKMTDGVHGHLINRASDSSQNRSAVNPGYLRKVAPYQREDFRVGAGQDARRVRPNEDAQQNGPIRCPAGPLQ